ncbi:MAG: glycosyltransferase [Actinomycetota bacterium]
MTQTTARTDGFHFRYRSLLAELKAMAELSIVLLGEPKEGLDEFRKLLSDESTIAIVPYLNPNRSRSRRALRAARGLITADLSGWQVDLVAAVNRTEPDLVVVTALGRQSLRFAEVLARWPTLLIAEEDTSVLSGFDRPESRAGQLLFAAEDSAFHRRVPQNGAVVVISRREVEWARSYFRTSSVTVVPHAIDMDYWSLGERMRSEPQAGVLAVGQFGMPRNARGLVDVAQALAARPAWQQRLKVISGTRPPMAQLPPFVDFLGAVDDPRAHYASSIACLVPAFEVSGTKTTVLQGWAMECPVVATSPAAASVEGTHDVDLLSGTCPDEVADSLIELMASEAMRSRLVKGGRRALHERHSPEGARAAFAAVVQATSIR